MITKQVIDSLYKKYRRIPRRLDDRNLGLLIDYALDHDSVTVEGDRLIFNQLNDLSPFREIEIERIHGVVNFADVIAVVLHSSIIFLNKETGAASVHVKLNPTSLRDKLRWWFRR